MQWAYDPVAMQGICQHLRQRFPSGHSLCLSHREKGFFGYVDGLAVTVTVRMQ